MAENSTHEEEMEEGTILKSGLTVSSSADPVWLSLRRKKTEFISALDPVWGVHALLME